MRIEVAEHARMSERGSSLLRLIQNNDMPILDLLVRESVQNSMDAALEGCGHINIEYHVRNFNSKEMNHHLEGIQESLDNRFPNSTYKLLEIRDSNTTGLTGPLHYKDVKDNQFGNLLKLIYEISMPQQQEGAGGSWGLGKTVYFRIGIGLVFYYSRIKNKEGEYSSRLAACLVEDERNEDALMHFYSDKPKRGIAWWGQKADETTTMPLTDDEEIVAILNIFNVKPYMDDETGTTIIIPYINEDNLLEGILPSDGFDTVGSIYKPWWTNSVHDYLKVALQKWYAPRLMNQNYKQGKWLRAIVNGEGISAEKMLPLFRVAQALYNKTPIAYKSDNNIDILTDIDVSVEKISLRNIFNENSYAGYISFVKMSKKQLLMNYPENNPSPFVQINKFDVQHDTNSPIIMYVRKPGMIVGFETAGHWTEGIPKTSSDEFIIGIFVANSSNTLKNSNVKMSIEEYLRKSEKADHTSWTDWNLGVFKPNIVSKIQRQVKASISKKYTKTTSELVSTRNIGLGRVLAEILLPPENFGSGPTLTKKNSNNNSSTKQTKGYGLKTMGQSRYERGKIKIDFELNCGKKFRTIGIELQVLSESGGIQAEEWEDEGVIGKEFPLVLDELVVNKIKADKQSLPYIPFDFYINNSTFDNLYENIELSALRTQKFNTLYGVLITVPEKSDYKIYGTASFTGRDDKVKGGLVLVQDEGVKK